MIRKPEVVARFERDDTRRRYAGMSYAESLCLFEALWAHAAALNPTFLERDPMSGLESALAVARGINGLPPRA